MVLKNDFLEVEISEYGASIVSIKMPDKNGNIVGEPLLGGIDSEENLNTLLDTISKANQDN